MTKTTVICDCCGATNPDYVWHGEIIGVGPSDLCEQCTKAMSIAIEEAWNERQRKGGKRAAPITTLKP